jgi:hypothetical protein
MTQSASNGAHVDTSGEKTRGHVMPEIMEANPRHPDPLAFNSFRPASNVPCALP